MKYIQSFEVVNEAKFTKEKIEGLIYSLENEKDSWHPSSPSKKKAMLDKLKKDLSKFESVVTEGKSWNDVARVMDAGLKKAKVPLSYARDYVKSLERMAKRNAKKFFAEYGNFSEDDFIEDVEYNMANEKVNEAEDTIGGLNKMANTDLERIADYADMIKDRMSQGQTLDAWMYSKISDSVKNLNSVHDTMDGNDGVNEARDADLIKQLTDTFSKFKLNRKYEIMMDSLFGGGSKIAVLRKRNTYGGGAMIDTHKKDGGSNYDGYIEILGSRSGRPIPGKSKFDNIDDAMKAATKFVDSIKESVNEATDLNDPFMIQVRVMKHAARERKAYMQYLKDNPKPKVRKISFDKYLDLLDTQSGYMDDLKDLTKQLQQADSDMNNEAGQKGDKWTDDDANRYGGILMDLEKEYSQLKAKKAKIDARIEKYKMS